MRRVRVLISALLVCAAALAQSPKTNPLPAPVTTGGRPLMQVLKERKSTREFSPERLSPQMLSNLLWAAFGTNRPDGRRTAPSASNRQEIDIYLAMQDGLYRFDAKAHALELVAAEDIRPATGNQDFVGKAPLNLVYVADYARMGGSDENKNFYSAANTGFIAQNVYLFCASEGLGTVVRGLVERSKLAGVMKLRPEQRITLSQTVGYPRK